MAVEKEFTEQNIDEKEISKIERKEEKKAIFRMHVYSGLFLVILLFIFFWKNGNAAKENASTEITGTLYAMDTYMTFTIYGDEGHDLLNACEDEIVKLDELLSTGNEKSEIGILNATKEVVFSDDTKVLFEAAREINKLTNGAFDITVYPVMKAWGFPENDYRIPKKEELEELTSMVNMDLIDYSEASGAVLLPEGVEIDFGGIAKGYAGDVVAERLKALNVKSALINLGGNVQTVGGKPDGSKWKIAIQNPNGSNEHLGVVEAADKAVITSGGYERFFETEGQIYHHIIDPKTGYPADSGLVSVTIVSDSGVLGDGLSTAVFVMGKDEAVKLYKKNSELFDMVLYTSENELFITKGIENDFTSEYEYTVIQ